MVTKIEKLCEEAGISMYQLSKDTGISQQTLSVARRRAKEKDKEVCMSIANIRKIAKRFDKPIEYFLED